MLIYATYAGSTLYNLRTPSSDQDIRGIFIEPADVFFSLNPVDYYEDAASDTVLYSLRKFVNIALKNNPNALELLFAPTSQWITSSMQWMLLYTNRRAFISQRAIKNYRGFIYQEYDNVINGKTTRLELLNTAGYDTKQASMVARLLINLRELKQRGEIQPSLQLHDRSLVYRIKRGDYTKVQVLQILDTLLPIIDMDSISLPVEPNYQLINDIVIHLYKTHYKNL